CIFVTAEALIERCPIEGGDLAPIICPGFAGCAIYQGHGVLVSARGFEILALEEIGAPQIVQTLDLVFLVTGVLADGYGIAQVCFRSTVETALDLSNTLVVQGEHFPVNVLNLPVDLESLGCQLDRRIVIAFASCNFAERILY